MNSLHPSLGEVDPIETLSRFRLDFYACLAGRADALFELTDALLCVEGPVRSLVDLSLVPEHRRGHGACTTGSTPVVLR